MEIGVEGYYRNIGSVDAHQLLSLNEYYVAVLHRQHFVRDDFLLHMQPIDPEEICYRLHYSVVAKTGHETLGIDSGYVIIKASNRSRFTFNLDLRKI